MLGPVGMSEVDIFVVEDDIDAVAQKVASLGIIHLQDPSSLGRWGEGAGTEWLGRVSAYATQERRVEELLDRLGVERVARPWDGRLDAADDLEAIEEELREVEAQVHAVADRESDLRREIRHWEMVVRSLSSLAPLSVSISDLRRLELLYLIVGTIPAENLARLEASLFRIPYAIIPVHHYGGRVLVFGFCAHEDAAILERALGSALLEPLALPEELGGTPQEAMAEANQRMERARSDLVALERESGVASQRLAPRLQSMLTRIRRDYTIADARARFGHTGRSYLMAGWVPKDRVAELEAAVEEASEGRATIEERPAGALDGDAQVPSLLRNPKPFRPFEGLVTIYGTPGYHDIDPTPILGITFVVMFGWMFGDVGHGSLLALAGLLLVLKLIPQLAGMAGAGVILLGCGLSSVVFGLLYGSMFGFEDIIPHLWISPMHDMMTLLMAAIGFGVVVLNVGLFCHVASGVRTGNFAEVVFDRNGIAGLLLYWSLLGVIASVALGGGISGWLMGVIGLLSLSLFFAKPLTNLLTGVRPLMHGSMVEEMVEAFFELFETFLGFVSNSLSFVRLGAFAVAHAGLSMAVLLLADMFGSSGVLHVLVIVVGNLFVIGFEGMIVGIQTLRLEYYELFGKFFEGQGVRFKPLSMPTV